MTGILTKRGHRDTHTGRMPCENEGRDQDDGAEAEERQRLPGNHQRQGKRHGLDSPSHPLQPSQGTTS